jgi:hypothetical protein
VVVTVVVVFIITYTRGVNVIITNICVLGICSLNNGGVGINFNIKIGFFLSLETMVAKSSFHHFFEIL